MEDVHSPGLFVEREFPEIELLLNVARVTLSVHDRAVGVDFHFFFSECFKVTRIANLQFGNACILQWDLPNNRLTRGNETRILPGKEQDEFGFDGFVQVNNIGDVENYHANVNFARRECAIDLHRFSRK